MSSNYHESREKQMNEKIHGMGSFQHVNQPYQAGEPMQTEHILKKEDLHHSSVQLLAYQIYQKKGGSALDNWLEAERILRDSHGNK